MSGKTRTCAKCGSVATGNFCGTCGAAVGSRHCTECGTALTAGARFCTQCGATSSAGPTATPTDGGDPAIGWWAAGGLLVVLILVVAWPILRPRDVAPPPPVATGPAAVDLNSISPIEAADRLFTRVMSAAEVGDSATVVTFVPMAIQAYERAAPLNEDGLFHLSSLQRTAGDFAAAVATADEGLSRDPDHLLLLYAAGEAASLDGRPAEARDYYKRLLDVYDAELASDNLDYQSHAGMMANVRAAALAFLGGGE